MKADPAEVGLKKHNAKCPREAVNLNDTENNISRMDTDHHQKNKGSERDEQEPVMSVFALKK